MPLVLLELLEQCKAAHVGKLEVEHHAVEALRAERLERRFAGADRGHLDFLVAADQLDHRLTLRLVVLHDEQPLEAAVDETADLAEGVLEALLRDRLLEECDSAGLERVLAPFARRDDVDRNVTGLRMVLQVIEHGPAVHHRQLHVEDDRVGFELVRERKARVTADGDESLEASLTSDLELGPGEIGVVLDDQHDAVSVLDVVAIVPDVTRQEQVGVELRRRGGRGGRTAAVPFAVAREHDSLLGRVGGVRVLGRLVRGRQEERERAALADFALDVDLAAEQSRDLAADREPEAGAAVTAARRPVRLLEGLEDQAELVLRDADSGVHDGELEHGLGT